MKPAGEDHDVGQRPSPARSAPTRSRAVRPARLPSRRKAATRAMFDGLNTWPPPGMRMTYLVEQPAKRRRRRRRYSRGSSSRRRSSVPMTRKQQRRARRRLERARRPDQPPAVCRVDTAGLDHPARHDGEHDLGDRQPEAEPRRAEVMIVRIVMRQVDARVVDARPDDLDRREPMRIVRPARPAATAGEPSGPRSTAAAVSTNSTGSPRRPLRRQHHIRFDPRRPGGWSRRREPAP